ncbi:hypothetical protein EV702DRAFT_1203359 [Suillus placidus]|uniref:Uncharacterized protein n=1 Tax=Suillus placidus TaxID=48579 RepID=A0A9P6ZJZ0_9AGAM|nr:hypothetical protein EV702DRAFT_1203359 [Suillus placidus]
MLILTEHPSKSMVPWLDPGYQDVDIYKSQRRLEKCKKRKRKWDREESRSPTQQEKTPPVHSQPLAHEQMDIDENGWYDIDKVENNLPGPSSAAGPSGIVPDPPVGATISACSGRQIRMPAQYADFVPGTATHLAHMPPTTRQACGQPSAPSASAPIPDSPDEELGTPPADVQPALIPYQTAPDELGLFRIYAQYPTLIPRRDQSLDAIADAPTFEMQGDPDLD